MDAFTISAASGMRARLESLEMLANNLANQSSPGFKSDRETYSLYVAPEAGELHDESAVQSPAAPVIESNWTDLRQGTLRQTGAPFDVALNGPGFFVVRSERGDLLTRNGNFKLAPTGTLETHDGYAVLDDQRRPIQIRQGATFEINQQGEIREEGILTGRLGIASLARETNLSKQAGTYFSMTDAAQLSPIPTASVSQGYLENSNLAPAEGAVRLVHILRQFESLTKAVQIHAEMNRRSDDVARISG